MRSGSRDAAAAAGTASVCVNNIIVIVTSRLCGGDGRSDRRMVLMLSWWRSVSYEFAHLLVLAASRRHIFLGASHKIV